jgi:hypothetical protein
MEYKEQIEPPSSSNANDKESTELDYNKAQHQLEEEQEEERQE